MKNLILIARVVFGAWMLANGVNHFLGQPLYPEPVGHMPLAIQLLTAFQHSRLFDVAMAMQLVCGALVLAGVILPVALCVVTPVNVCAVFWALILDHNPTASLLALAALALNGLLMLAYIDYYKGMLQRHALSLGETEGGGMTWNQTFAWSTGRTSHSDYIKALVPLVLAAAFYTFLAKTGRNGEWVLATLIYPGFVLVAGRLHDMGQTGWLLAAPGLVVVIALGLHFFDAKASFTAPVGVAAYVVSIAFLAWGLIGKGQAEANRFGAPAPA
jgi:uncharacterized membrane protein YhaH (DUF805 family)/uncharacterized membrane protein YphA (DoxX/SURF4 family)